MFYKPYHQPPVCVSALIHSQVCDHGSAQPLSYHYSSTSVPDYHPHLQQKSYYLSQVHSLRSCLIFLDWLTVQGFSFMLVITIAPRGAWNSSHSLWTQLWLPLLETRGTCDDSGQSYVSYLVSNQHKQSLHARQRPQKSLHGATQPLLITVCSLAYRYSVWSKLGPHCNSSLCLDLCWQRMTL